MTGKKSTTPKVYYDLYIINDKEFDRLTFDGVSGKEAQAITIALPDFPPYSIFRSNYWPSKYKRNCKPSARVFMNHIRDDYELVNLILHEVAGHGILLLGHDDSNGIMAEHQDDTDASQEERLAYLKVILTNVTHFRITYNKIPV